MKPYRKREPHMGTIVQGQGNNYSPNEDNGYAGVRGKIMIT